MQISASRSAFPSKGPSYRLDTRPPPSRKGRWGRDPPARNPRGDIMDGLDVVHPWGSTAEPGRRGCGTGCCPDSRAPLPVEGVATNGGGAGKVPPRRPSEARRPWSVQKNPAPGWCGIIGICREGSRPREGGRVAREAAESKLELPERAVDRPPPILQTT